MTENPQRTPQQKRRPARHRHRSSGPRFDLTKVTAKDAANIKKQIKKAKTPEQREKIAASYEAAAAKYTARQQSVPQINYPQQLPVSQKAAVIKQALAEHQVIIVAGETGSGKTTQLPKICLELGRGVDGMIGHTQPRRLAARTVAERIAAELNVPVGPDSTVGYAIRFDDQAGDNTLIKLMTDGILLAELQRDPLLLAYDTLIIDEAHERSLNIDFLLGYLSQMLQRRPELKVIVTSATIDPESFANHFSAILGAPVPIIEVTGRTYPVEIRYRPLERETPDGQIEPIEPLEGLAAAVKELLQAGSGDILVFFPGEREIREAQEHLERKVLRGRAIEVIPLFGRLSNQEQHRVFTPGDKRRIVLATNIAETSLTVPGIHYCIDTGTARISRYSTRTKVQRLPIEPISQASANQRSGRCGRIADGIAIRLYSEEDFLARPLYTDPEILRTNLASVILQMSLLRLGDISAFPFIQPPDPKAIRDGLLLLHELGALEQSQIQDAAPRLTKTGRMLAKIPVDPRLARMLLAAHEQDAMTLARVIVIVAALSLQDVRERPLEAQAAADKAHARFNHSHSDFAALLHLWFYVNALRGDTSGNSWRKQLQAEFLHVLRIREWQDLVAQLVNICRDLGWQVAKTKPTPASITAAAGDLTLDPTVKGGALDQVHQALLAGLLSQIGQREGASKQYQGARGTHFQIFPGSTLADQPPAFLMAGALVETSKLWARDVAPIDPLWAEELGAHLLKYSYGTAYWQPQKANSFVLQRATLFGVPIITDRPYPFAKVDRAAAREMFIRHALVEGGWNTNHQFFHDNAEKLEQALELEDKARRRDIVVDEQTLFDFYAARIPETVTSGITFDAWWKQKRKTFPKYLDFDPDKLVADGHQVTEADYPDVFVQGSLVFDLTYNFAPGTAEDGVTMLVPVPLLAGLDGEQTEWLVPGLRLELLIELIRTLPKALRKQVVPAPEVAAKALPLLHPYHGSIRQQFADVLRSFGARDLTAADFDLSKLPGHLRFTFAAIDKRGKIIDSDKDLAALKKRQAGGIHSSMQKVAKTTKADTKWTSDTLGEIPLVTHAVVDGQKVSTYPALMVAGEKISVAALPTQEQAEAAMLTATITLLAREITVQPAPMIKGLPLQHRVAVENYPHGGAAGLVKDATVAAIRDELLAQGGPVRDPEQFAGLTSAVAGGVPARVRKTVVTLAPALVTYEKVAAELAEWSGEAIVDMKNQLEFLLPVGAISKHGLDRLQHLPRYLAAMQHRLEQMDLNPDRDADNQDEIERVKLQLAERLRRLPSGREKTTEVKNIQWMLEELRVSLFAQQLGTAYPISARRIEKAIAKLR